MAPRHASNSKTQLCSGLWGIFYFNEIVSRDMRIKWFASAIITVAGILLLSHEHEGWDMRWGTRWLCLLWRWWMDLNRKMDLSWTYQLIEECARNPEMNNKQGQLWIVNIAQGATAREVLLKTTYVKYQRETFHQNYCSSTRSIGFWLERSQGKQGD